MTKKRDTTNTNLFEMNPGRELFAILLPLILIGFLIYDYVKLYHELTAVDNYTATGYFQKYENQIIYLDSCTVVHFGNTEFYDLFVLSKQLDSTTVLRMSKYHNKITILYRYNKVVYNRGLSGGYVTKVIRISDDKSIIYQYDYQGAIKDGIIMISIIVFLSVLYYIWLFKDFKKDNNPDNNGQT